MLKLQPAPALTGCDLIRPATAVVAATGGPLKEAELFGKY